MDIVMYLLDWYLNWSYHAGITLAFGSSGEKTFTTLNPSLPWDTVVKSELHILQAWPRNGDQSLVWVGAVVPSPKLGLWSNVKSQGPAVCVRQGSQGGCTIPEWWSECLITPAVLVGGPGEQELPSDVYGKGEAAAGEQQRCQETGQAAGPGQNPSTAVPGRRAQAGAGAAGAGAAGLSRNLGLSAGQGGIRTPGWGRTASLGMDKWDPAGTQLAPNTGCAAKGRKGRHTEPPGKQIRGPWWCLGENQKCSRLRAGATAAVPGGWQTSGCWAWAQSLGWGKISETERASRVLRPNKLFVVDIAQQ